MSVQNDENARNQAIAQLESIKEMVANLDREQSAKLFVGDLPRERIIELLADLDADSDGEERKDAFKSRKDDDTEDLREELAANIADETITPDDFKFDDEEARQTIQEDPLSVEVRSGWYTPGSEDNEPAEYMILLCTGGPAVRIRGDLDRGQPDSARIEYQDWFTPWTELITMDGDHAALLTYAQQFYFGE